MFSWFGKKKTEQSGTDQWQDQWRGIVPPECRNVPVEWNGESIIAYIQIHHYAVMLQDGLLMEEAFFPVCEHFQKAGYHVVWLMRCTQDIENGFLKMKGREHDDRVKWLWKSPTTNFGRWMTDQQRATILLQYRELPDGSIAGSEEQVLARVVWAESDHPEMMVPGRTVFYTEDIPATPGELIRWLNGEKFQEIAESRK